MRARLTRQQGARGSPGDDAMVKGRPPIEPVRRWGAIEIASAKAKESCMFCRDGSEEWSVPRAGLWRRTRRDGGGCLRLRTGSDSEQKGSRMLCRWAELSAQRDGLRDDLHAGTQRRLEAGRRWASRHKSGRRRSVAEGSQCKLKLLGDANSEMQTQPETQGQRRRETKDR